MKTYFITALFIAFTITTFGQRKGDFKEKKEQIKALKIAHITTELNLTSDEAAKFWPLYNAFDEKQQEIRKQKIKSFMDKSKEDAIDKLTEKEATTILNQIESNDEELHQLKKKFVASLKGVLPAVKILKLKKAEEDFSKKLLQQYRDKKVKR